MDIELLIPDGRLAIEETYGFNLLSKFLSEMAMLEAGVPYSEMGFGERRAESTTKIVEVQNQKKDFIKDKIAVVDLRGLIRADDTFYSYGTRTKGEQLLEAKDDVIGALFRIDSGGGYSDGAEVMISAMREFGKPIVALSGSTTASAAYMIASEAQQIFAETEFSSFGSIGVYITLDKTMRELINKNLLFAYSEKSQNKNRPQREFLASGEIKEYIKEATQYDEAFMKLVKTNRMLGDNKEETLSGGMWTRDEARKRGLIDGKSNIQESLKVIQKLAA